jgi:peptidoglycan/xylan/chitin deacetylase (PgdA/CDA1 family)
MGKVIISYDCEGLWGMLDKINQKSYSCLKTESIKKAYSEIYRLHEINHVSATFAFVAAFTLPYKIFADYLPNLKELPNIKSWLSGVDWKSSALQKDRWFMPDLIYKLKECSFNYEIASHGYTHVILTDCTDNELAVEALGIKTWAEYHELNLQTIVFPRNKINEKVFRYIDLNGFRRAPKKFFLNPTLDCGYRLMREFYPFAKSEECITLDDNILAIPGDFFINWRSGFRSLVPEKLTFKRAKYAIDHSIKNKGVVNFWLHPHNLITGKKQIDLLAEIIEYIAYRQKEGDIQSLTQADLIDVSE